MSKGIIIRDLQISELEINNDLWMKLYLEGKYDELAVLLLEIAASFAQQGHCLQKVTQPTQYFIDTYCGSLGYFFTQPKFQISQKNIVIKFLYCNTTIANLFAISCYQTTDVFIKQLLRTQNNFTKLLILYNARTITDIPYENLLKLGSANQEIFSVWYATFVNNSPLTKQIQKTLSNHLKHTPQELEISYGSSSAYFQCTYNDNELDRNYKQLFNNTVQKKMQAKIKSTPNKKNPHIAVVSHKWFKESAIYRSVSPYLNALSKHYKMTLINLGVSDEKIEIEDSLFQKVIYIDRDIESGILDISKIEKNNFSLVLYTDVGMDFESRILSNLRIAPLQATMYGHPVSTFGSQIDFFIGGEDTELETKASENYSEKLVTIKGIGAIPLKSDYAPKEQKNCFEDKNILFLGSMHKINNHILTALEKIKEAVKELEKELRFIFVPGGSISRSSSYIVTTAELKKRLGENTEVNVPLKMHDYMERINSSSICLDSYPFGGFNSIMDALHLKKPVVAYEGTKAYNRLASAVLRRLGLDELIATSQEEYIAIATRLLSDEVFYNKVVEHIENIDIDALLHIREDELEDFVDKIGQIIDGKIKNDKK